CSNCAAARFRSRADDRRRLLTHETTKIETALSLLWFAAIQRIERKQDLASLAPKRCFITAQAIEREVGQISETQKAPCELDSPIDSGSDRIRLGGLHGFCVRYRIAIVPDCVSPAEYRMENFLGG